MTVAVLVLFDMAQTKEGTKGPMWRGRIVDRSASLPNLFSSLVTHSTQRVNGR